MLSAGTISQTTAAKMKASYKLLSDTLKWYVFLIYFPFLISHNTLWINKKKKKKGREQRIATFL